ncbi:MAG: 2'-5' RNA ligase family protein [bacterium]
MFKNDKIAINILFFPTKDIMQLAVKINQQKGSENYQNLNIETNPPHITLAMGVIDVKNLPLAKEKIRRIAKNFSKLELTLSGICHGIRSNGKKSYYFKVEIIPELQKLHEEIMNGFSKILIHGNVSAGMFLTDAGEKIDEKSCPWVEDYPNKVFKNFDPHISLKCWNAKYEGGPLKFTVDKLILCRMGNFCTCRKILFSASLNNSAK